MNQSDMLDLSDLCDRFINYSAYQLKLFYKKEIIARWFAGLATSKVLILEGISGTGKTSLPYAMGKFFNNPTAIISVQPSWRDRSELLGYLNEFTKRFNETDFLKAVYASSYSDTINLIVLDEMNLARIEYYFAEFLSVMEMPDPSEWKIDIVPVSDVTDPKNLINGKILIPQNLWFIGTANKDDSTFTITDKVYDRAVAIAINKKADFIDAPYTDNVNMTFEYLDDLFKRYQNGFNLSEVATQAFNTLDEFIQEKFKIAFGNRIMKQIKLFVPVYMACGFSEFDGLDYMLTFKILRKFEMLNLTFLKKELDELILMLDRLFGKDQFLVSKEFIADLKKMA
jgi:5-methylcytosine-specific restriction endonuclease McrBC GTP-binding regulatory subunit McrB